jgi:hypothetical protein
VALLRALVADVDAACGGWLYIYFFKSIHVTR